MVALEHREPDRVPPFEIWIDALWDELGQVDVRSAHVNQGRDCVMMPTRRSPVSNAWKTGLDEWGRVWKDGTYVDGVVDTEEDLGAVRAEVDRCLAQGARGGGYMLATCNSIFEGMNPHVVTEMFRYEQEVGRY